VRVRVTFLSDGSQHFTLKAPDLIVAVFHRPPSGQEPRPHRVDEMLSPPALKGDQTAVRPLRHVTYHQLAGSLEPITLQPTRPSIHCDQSPTFSLLHTIVQRLEEPPGISTSHLATD